MGITAYKGSGLGEKESVFLGIDIGSVSLNSVLMDKDFNILENYYDYVHGKPFHVLYERLTGILDKNSPDNIRGIIFTGSGGKLGSQLVGGAFVNEIIAQATSAGTLYPSKV